MPDRDDAQSDTMFRALLEAAPDAMVIVNESGEIALVNAQTERLFGYLRSEMLGQRVEMLVPDRYRTQHKTHRARYFHAARPRPMGAGIELFGRRKDGTEFPVEISLSPVTTPRGVLAISAIRDISDRKRAEARFRMLLESAPDAIVIVNRDGEIVLVNVQTERLFGFPRAELLGQSVELLIPERYRIAHAGYRQGYLVSAHARPMGRGLELFGRRRDGSEFPVEISLSPLETEEGLLVASAIRDITDRKAADAERARLLQERATTQEASRIKDEFIATVSHELRTPLNAILGWTALIESGAVDQDGLRKAIGIIKRNARMQAQLVEDLLDVSRVVSGKLRLHIRQVDLTDIADAALDVVRPAADATRITLSAEYPDRPVVLIGDPDRLQQVIWNLLNNAVKFTAPGGVVELRIAVNDGFAELRVRDSGQGIRPDLLASVFDRFRQGDSSTTRRHGGLGLGLAIARSLVELHGGTIEAASSGEGKGATFRVVLPLRLPSARASATSRPGGLAETRPDAVLPGKRILIVDDQPDERLLLCAIFGQYGVECRAVDSVSAALLTLRTWRVDLVVSDVAMPDQDGYTLVRTMRETPGLAHIPAVAVTAHARLEDRDAARAAGFGAYIAKPIDQALLLRHCAELVQTQPS